MTQQKEHDVFDRAYGVLNAEQKQAVDAIEGPVMVIAGPGTGKTQILSLRIANILRETDAAPSAILALTFTEAGVAAMRERLARLMGARGYQVRIHTFHGFCNTVITRYPERFPRIIGSTQILEIDAYRILESILDSGTYATLRPSNHPYYYVRELKSVISECKRENIDPDTLLMRIDEAEAHIQGADDLYHEKGAHKGKIKGVYQDALTKLVKAREFCDIYRAYEVALSRDHHYDFEDTILEVVRMLERDDELKLMLQEEHQYILADEHQDANGAQNRLLELLSDFHDAPNLFIVGDEKQAIYRFQGASLANFLYFKDRYPQAITIELTSNYRSTQVILDAAHAMIAHTQGHSAIGRPRLQAYAGHTHTPLTIASAPHETAELAFLGERITALIDSGAPASSIAVLARRNSDVATIARSLRSHGIAVASLHDEEVLGLPLVRAVLDLVRAVACVGDDAALYPLLYAPFVPLENLDIYKLTEKRPGNVSLSEALGSAEVLSELGVRNSAACVALFETLNDIATFAKDASLEDSFDYAIHRGGVITYLLGKQDAHEALAALDVLVRYVARTAAAHPQYGFRELLESLATAQTYGVSLLVPPKERENMVRVLTVHKSKGLEYDHVVVPFCHDARWGASRSRSGITLPLYETGVGEDVREDDERRLLYVAMTRARKTLTCSYATRGDDGRAQVPSRFLADMPDEMVEHIAIPESGAQFLPRTVLAREELLTREREYIVERLRTQGLSVSALNNYLESPWRYFFQNLLRIPSRREPHQLFGTAMDGALKLLTHMEKQGEVVEDGVVAEFERILASFPLRPQDARAYHARGTKALTGYLSEYRSVRSTAVDAGVSFAVPFETGIAELPLLTLRGEYDRIEFLGGNEVRVVDFKTGTHKSRNYIEGNTKDSNGNYKRQLVFYALLGSLDTVRNWQVREGVIDFVESDEKGKYHREVFAISPEDVESLRADIVRAVREIIACAFISQECSEDLWSKEGVALVEAYLRRFFQA